MSTLALITLMLSKAGIAGADLVSLLEKIVATAPDLAPLAQKILDALKAQTDSALQAEIAIQIVAELGNVAQLHFDGQTHPGDGA